METHLPVIISTLFITILSIFVIMYKRLMNKIDNVIAINSECKNKFAELEKYIGEINETNLNKIVSLNNKIHKINETNSNEIVSLNNTIARHTVKINEINGTQWDVDVFSFTQFMDKINEYHNCLGITFLYGDPNPQGCGFQYYMAYCEDIRAF